MSNLTARLEGLTPEQRKLLELLYASRQKSRLSIPRASRESARMELSYAQQRLWFIDQLEPESRAYNIPIGVRMKGALDVVALERSLEEVVRRHEVLRTRVDMADGRGVQVIEEEWSGKLEQLDLSGEGGAEREAALEREAREEGGRRFDLGRGPLFRAKLVKLGEQEHVLLVTMHHIVSDGWSMGILVKEVAGLYESYVEGRGSGLPELAIQYADYAIWQRSWLQGEVLEKQLGYWREQLAGVAVLELATDRMRPAVMSHAGGVVGIRLGKELTRKLKELSQREGVTLFMTLLAGYQLLLSRYIGQEDIAVGTDVANRTHAELEGLIGFFVNQLVMRTNLGGNPSVREMLGRVREVSLEAYGHQDLPFERLVEELNPARDLSRSPLFQTMIVLENAPMTGRSLGGLSVEPYIVAGDTAKFDMTLTIEEEDAEGMSGSVEYSTELYEAKTIERMLGHWEQLLKQMVGGPEKRIGELELLGEEEREEILEEWNRTEEEYERELCIHELIERRSAEECGQAAVVCGVEEVSFTELEARANRLSRYLRGKGVGPEV